jgi:OPT family small oligopeptide transporter
MEQEAKSLGSSTNVASILPQFLRPRHVPDVPEDVDFLMEHLNDPNYDLRSPRRVSAATTDYDEEHKKHPTASADQSRKGSDFDAESRADTDRYSHEDGFGSHTSGIDFDDESPYPEVRAAVANIDDPLMPNNTFRMWFLGLFFTIFISGLNQLFDLRYPSVTLTGIVAQLTALPMGKGLAKILPTKRFRTFGYTWTLNPGPFNIKEHVVITVMANIVVFGAYATDIIATQRFFYGQSPTFGYQILVILSTQLFGFSLGGLLRRFAVWPASMIWPGALVNAALFNTLHKNYGRSESNHVSRMKFFCIALACSFVWYWVPGYLWTGLSIFNWVCWIAPNNIVVNILFGTNTGLGWSIITFDWAIISYIGSPLVTPWWSEANTMAALVVCFWIIAPILYFTNTFYAKYMPISGYSAFDNTGMPYDPTAILSNGTFDVEKYRAYSPVFIPTTLAVAYGVAFASFAAVIVHTGVWYSRDIARRFRNSLKDERDIHSRLMQVYPEVPHWWYASIGVVTVIFLLVSISVFHTGLPIWAAIIALIFATILAIPLAMIQAITNQSISFNVMHEVVAGYMVPGKPVANMIFKAIALMGSSQAVTFAGDLKLGHYMKVPPRIMFLAQTVAAVVSCFVVTGVQQWMFSNIADICTTGQKHGFVCPPTRAFANASLLWGGVGPRRIFGSGSPYSALLWFFLVGALAPFPFYYLARRFPLSFWRYINTPVFFAGVAAIPIANPENYAAWGITGFIFNYVIRRYRFRWWMRYNYILSAALDAGVAIALIAIFFILQLPKGGFQLSWWGNNVWQNTADAMGTPFYVLNPGETFGPSSWS